VVTANLEVEESRRRIELTEGDPALRAAPLNAPNVRQVFSWSGVPQEAPVEGVAIVARPSLRLQTNLREERIERVTIHHTQADLITIQYALAGVSGSLNMFAPTGRIDEQTQSLQPFRTLKRQLRLRCGFALLAGLGFWMWFVGRHWFYAQSPAAGAAAWLAVALPLCVAIQTISAAKPAHRRRIASSVVAAVPAIAVLAILSLLTFQTGPSLANARTLRAAGDTENARREALAAAELNIEREDAEKLHDEIQLAGLTTEPAPVARWRAVEQARYLLPTSRQRAREDAAATTVTYLAARHRAGDFSQTAGVLLSVPTAMLTPDGALTERASEYRGHRVKELWAVIESRAPLEARLRACSDVSKPLEELGDGATRFAGVAAPTVLRQCAKAEDARRAQLARQEREAKLAQLAAERAARAAEAREQARARSWATAPLACRDGTLSPTCVCGGSRRGCCSHHGGVAGCSQ
jgi:hypothetical protein